MYVIICMRKVEPQKITFKWIKSFSRALYLRHDFKFKSDARAIEFNDELHSRIWRVANDVAAASAKCGPKMATC